MGIIALLLVVCPFRVRASTVYTLKKAQDGLLMFDPGNGTYFDAPATDTHYETPPTAYEVSSDPNDPIYTNETFSIPQNAVIKAWLMRTGSGDSQPAIVVLKYENGTVVDVLSTISTTAEVSEIKFAYLQECNAQIGIRPGVTGYTTSYYDDILLMKSDTLEIQGIPSGWQVVLTSFISQSFTITLTSNGTINLNVTNYYDKLPFSKIEILDDSSNEILVKNMLIVGGDVLLFLITKETLLTMDTDKLLYESGAEIKVNGTLKEANGNPIAGFPITITLSNISKTVNTGLDGSFVVTFTAPDVSIVKTFTIIAEFNGKIVESTEYLQSNATKSIVVYSVVSGEYEEGSDWWAIIFSLLPEWDLGGVASTLALIPSLVLGFLGALLAALVKRAWKWILIAFFVFTIAGFAVIFTLLIL